MPLASSATVGTPAINKEAADPVRFARMQVRALTGAGAERPSRS